MGAVALWVRSVLRRTRFTTVSIALLAGLSAGVIGAAFQAARRADGSVERYSDRSRSYDVVVQGCPPEIADPFQLSFADTIKRCLSNDAAGRFGTEVLASMPEVEAWTTAGFLLAGVVDDSAPNGWGYGVLLLANGAPDAIGMISRQILVDGRQADPAASDELMIGELAAHAGGIHVGDTIRLASWRQDSIDAATSSGIAPETVPFESRVVGIVRSDADLQQLTSESDLTKSFLPDGLIAGPGWVAAHGDDFASYGFGVVVRLRAGPTEIEAFGQAVAEAADGWSGAPPFPISDIDVPTLQRVIRAEREAVVIFALIALVAGIAFVGLTLARQVRRELVDAPALLAVGLTRRDLLIGATVRVLVAGGLAVAVALVTVLAISPLGPVGVARRLEYSHDVRADWPVLMVLLVVVPLFFAAVAAAIVVSIRTGRRSPRAATATSVVPLGAVPSVSLSLARGSSPRVAVGVGAAAVAVAVAAGVFTASFDRVIEHPVRYGAWWDVAVGQYSDSDELQASADLLATNPMVADAAGFLEDSDIAIVNGLQVPYLAVEPFLGRSPTVMASGLAPAAADEVALGAATARELDKAIGDTIAFTSKDSSLSLSVVVTGIAVLNNPVTSATNAGDGVVVHPDLVRRMESNDPVAQSIVIRFVPSADRQDAIDSVVSDFGGSTRLAQPQIDLSNLERLRLVPWLVAALVGMLALATLVHALITLLHRHTGDLAVLAALGMTNRQRRGVGIGAGIVIVAGSIVIGVPIGLIVGRWVWQGVAERIFIPSGPVMPWGPTVAAPLIALAVAVCVAAMATLRSTRRAPASELHTE